MELTGAGLGAPGWGCPRPLPARSIPTGVRGQAWWCLHSCNPEKGGGGGERAAVPAGRGGEGVSSFSSSPRFRSCLARLQLESIPAGEPPSAAKYSARVLLVNLRGERSAGQPPWEAEEKEKQPSSQCIAAYKGRSYPHTYLVVSSFYYLLHNSFTFTVDLSKTKYLGS